MVIKKSMHFFVITSMNEDISLLVNGRTPHWRQGVSPWKISSLPRTISCLQVLGSIYKC